jgi:ribulose-phosphate 3-epimerase
LKLAPSILAADLLNFQQWLKQIEAANCEFLHFDVMDGHFVPNLTFGVPFIAQVRKLTKIPFDVHLMVTNPEDYITPLAELGVELVSFHVEAEKYSPRLLKRLQECGMLASIALNPQTPLDPGFYGQPFIETMAHKIEKLHAYREDRELLFTIEVDGGVCEDNLETLRQIGVDMVVAGKAFFQAKDPTLFAAHVHGTRRRFHA